jgi:hypothetical protein
MSGRGFPSQWTVEDHDACFIVRDANGQALGYFYFEEDAGRIPREDGNGGERGVMKM